MVKHRGDDICGVLLLDKPSGRSSNFYLQRVKHLFNAKKAGHTGSLDPLATGLLPICFGKATCISEYFLHSDKAYEATIQLGETTDSHDSDGQIVARKEVNITDERFQQVLQEFQGEIEQIPPMVSALKHQGQPLYKLALQGKDVNRKPRKMHVYSISGQLLNQNQAKLQVHCSSGFYVRQLAADIGELLGCGAHIIALRRTQSKHLSIAHAISFEQLLDEFDKLPDQREMKSAYIESKLLSADLVLDSLPALFVEKEGAEHVSHGRKLRLDQIVNDQLSMDLDQHYRLYQLVGEEHHFLGIAELSGERMLKVRRLFNSYIDKS